MELRSRESRMRGERSFRGNVLALENSNSVLQPSFLQLSSHGSALSTTALVPVNEQPRR